MPYAYTNQDLESLFSPLGKVVSASVVIDRMTNRSRGFGFVEMENDEEAQKAIQEVNGKDVDGRKISVSVARPKEDRPRNNNQGGNWNNNQGNNNWNNNQEDSNNNR